MVAAVEFSSFGFYALHPLLYSQKDDSFGAMLACLTACHLRVYFRSQEMELHFDSNFPTCYDVLEGIVQTN